ncbi:MAG: hypothetical protein EOP47_17960 [Sphingobacteriaceae bacterium]|nr:MAG: hypothetical protein EOP47_17960 [Sphingobacteriaceae bacterium]
MIRNRKFLMWFLRFGRLNGSLIYFLFLITSSVLITVVHSFLFQFINHKPFIKQLTDNNGSVLFLLIAIIYMTWDFYNNALKWVREADVLHKKGLSRGDVLRIDFVKDWDQKRRDGIFRFCLLQGGILSGILLFPLLVIGFALAIFFHLLTDFRSLVYLAGSCLIVCYITGVIVYLFRWKYNERKFQKLTNPLNLQ